ncbi:MAG: NAD(P)H-hydrate dehydratase [Thermoanaerobaculia bacterium]
MPVLDARQMKAADRRAIRAGVPAERLMENAAAGLVQALLETRPGWRRVVVACGPGNNGGDGLAAARMLARDGLSVSVFTLRDPESYAGAAAVNARRARAAGLEFARVPGPRGIGAFRRALDDADGVVDALFGTGLSRPLSGIAETAVAAINRSERGVASADVPSGLSSDTGELLGPCVRADLTAAFAAAKHCHVFHPARSFCGDLRVAPIGIPARLLAARGHPLWLVEEADVRRLLPARAEDSHKGDFGRVAVIAGSRGKAGAAVLAGRGALRAGAGLVTIFCPASLEATIVSALPEAMTRGLPERAGEVVADGAAELAGALEGFDAVAAGPGLGSGEAIAPFLRQVLKLPLPLVCDADALNAMPGLPAVWARRRAATVLTPHPGEAGRLLGVSTKEVQRDRVAAARRLARRSGAVVILKGAATLIADPAGTVRVNPTGSPLMASAGAGDVLTGAVAALLAGGLRALEAAYCAAYLHGAAGELLAASLGDAGLLAHELADAMPLARDGLREPR